MNELVFFLFAAFPKFFFLPAQLGNRLRLADLWGGGVEPLRMLLSKKLRWEEEGELEKVWKKRLFSHTQPFLNGNAEFRHSNVRFVIPTPKLPTPENAVLSRYVIGTLRGEGVFNGHPRFWRICLL